MASASSAMRPPAIARRETPRAASNDGSVGPNSGRTDTEGDSRILAVMPRAAACLALLAALALSACGSSKLSADSIEKLIVKDLGPRGYAGLRVSCQDVDDTVGKQFTCDVSGVKAVTKVDGTVLKGDRISIDRLR